MMRSWNYRIVKYKDGSGYGLHEVHYDENGQPWSMTDNPINFTAEDSEDESGDAQVREAINRACADANERKILVEPEKWPGKSP